MVPAPGAGGGKHGGLTNCEVGAHVDMADQTPPHVMPKSSNAWLAAAWLANARKNATLSASDATVPRTMTAPELKCTHAKGTSTCTSLVSSESITNCCSTSVHVTTGLGKAGASGALTAKTEMSHV